MWFGFVLFTWRWCTHYDGQVEIRGILVRNVSLLPPRGSWGWTQSHQAWGGNAVNLRAISLSLTRAFGAEKVMWPELSARKQEHTECCVESKDTGDKPIMNPSKRWQAPRSVWQCLRSITRRVQVQDPSWKHGPAVGTIEDHLSKNICHLVTGILVQTIRKKMGDQSIRKWIQTLTWESSFFLLPLYLNKNVAFECQTA